MKKTHLIDFSVLMQPLQDHPLESVERRWRECGDEALGVSIISEIELRTTLLVSHQSHWKERFENYFQNRIAIFPLDEAVMEEWSAMLLSQPSVKSQEFDLIVAATAKVSGLILATLHPERYAGWEGLAVEDWSK